MWAEEKNIGLSTSQGLFDFFFKTIPLGLNF